MLISDNSPFLPVPFQTNPAVCDELNQVKVPGDEWTCLRKTSSRTRFVRSIWYHLLIYVFNMIYKEGQEMTYHIWSEGSHFIWSIGSCHLICILAYIEWWYIIKRNHFFPVNSQPALCWRILAHLNKMLAQEIWVVFLSTTIACP